MSGRCVRCLALAALAALAAGCGRGEPEGVYGSGTLEATEVTVSALTGGRIVEMAVDEGASVAAGALLARIDVGKLETRRERAAAALLEVRASREAARRTESQAATRVAYLARKHARVTALVAEAAATRQQLDDLATELAVQQNALAAARASVRALEMKERQVLAEMRFLDDEIADGTVTAPIAGVVLTRFTEAGETARPSQPLVTVADLSRLWVRVYVPEEDVGRLQLGAGADVCADAFPGRTFPGRVAWISPRAEFTPKNVQTREARADLVYAVKVNVANPRGDLKIGMPADVYVREAPR